MLGRQEGGPSGRGFNHAGVLLRRELTRLVLSRMCCFKRGGAGPSSPLVFSFALDLSTLGGALSTSPPSCADVMGPIVVRTKLFVFFSHLNRKPSGHLVFKGTRHQIVCHGQIKSIETVAYHHQ